MQVLFIEADRMQLGVRWVVRQLENSPSRDNRLSLAQYTTPTFLLLELSGSPINKWNGSSEALVGAHHIFPKSTLAWLWEHTTNLQKSFIRKLLAFDKNSGTGALARLRSNLISPRTITSTVVEPQMRGDDPHHKYKYRVRSGEESLDMVRTRSGHLEPRSAIYRHLAWYVVHVVYPVYAAAKQRRQSFTLSDENVVHIAHCLLNAERIHYYVEVDPTLPSHASSGIWALDSQGKFRKQLVVASRLGSERQLEENYLLRRTKEQRERKERRDQQLRLGLGGKSKVGRSVVRATSSIDRTVPTEQRDIEVNGLYYSLREYISWFGLAHYTNK
ncbi:MAG: hypothetical protein AB1Z98_35845 [Nannocystaceae bacterium]